MDPRDKHDQIVRNLNGKRPLVDAQPAPPSQGVMVGLGPGPDGKPIPVLQVITPIVLPLSIEAAREIAQNLLDACDKAEELTGQSDLLVPPPTLFVP